MLSENLITFLMTPRKAPQTVVSPDFRLVKLFLFPPKGMFSPKGMETTSFRSLSDVEFEDASSEGRCFGLPCSSISPVDFDRLRGRPGFLSGKRKLEIEENLGAGRVDFSFPFCVAASWDILICVCVKDALRGSEIVRCETSGSSAASKIAIQMAEASKEERWGGTKSGAVIK
jgi:hypothetical protein